MSKIVAGPNDLPDLLEEESKSVEENTTNPDDKEGLHRDDGQHKSHESLSLSTKLRLEEQFLDAELLSDDPSASTATNNKSDYRGGGSIKSKKSMSPPHIHIQKVSSVKSSVIQELINE